MVKLSLKRCLKSNIYTIRVMKDWKDSIEYSLEEMKQVCEEGKELMDLVKEHK